MSVNLSPLAGAGWQFFNDSGVPLAGGLLYTYEAGTTTPLATYTSATGNTYNSNPIVLNAAGRVSEEVWLINNNSYKFLLKDSNNVQIWSMDNLTGIASVGQAQLFTATQGQTVFNLSFSFIVGGNSLQVFVNGCKQVVNLNYTEASSIRVIFVDGLNVGDVVEFIQ